MKTVPPNVELLKLAEALESVMPRWVILPQASRLTSTAWNGNARSTTSATLIDMSAVFGTPANIDAVLLRVSVRDSGSSGAPTYGITLDNTTIGNSSTTIRCGGMPDDSITDDTTIIPTDANGDIYYKIVASGVNTLDAWIFVLGYHLR
ncbi:MAG TPA: hypothetical protein P5195_08915 [Anaerolineae bacterium]|nr:hypothetical protein [Anaerolineae bacterium]